MPGKIEGCSLDVLIINHFLNLGSDLWLLGDPMAFKQKGLVCASTSRAHLHGEYSQSICAHPSRNTLSIIFHKCEHASFSNFKERKLDGGQCASCRGWRVRFSHPLQIQFMGKTRARHTFLYSTHQVYCVRSPQYVQLNFFYREFYN